MTNICYCYHSLISITLIRGSKLNITMIIIIVWNILKTSTIVESCLLSNIFMPDYTIHGYDWQVVCHFSQQPPSYFSMDLMSQVLLSNKWTYRHQFLTSFCPHRWLCHLCHCRCTSSHHYTVSYQERSDQLPPCAACRV